MKLLKIFFILIFLAFPLGEIFRIDLGNNISIRLLDIIIGFTAVTFILISISKKKIPSTHFNKPLVLFILICILSLIINSAFLSYLQLLVASLYLLRWASYAAIYFVLLNLDKAFKKLIPFILLFEGLLILILGYIQYFLYPNLRNLFYMGWDEHNYRMFSTSLSRIREKPRCL